MPGVREELCILEIPPHDKSPGHRCQIAPHLGFNCVSWEVNLPAGPQQVLWKAPDFETNPVPTRSGIPILFPFPNRIRDGRFTWDGKQYQLPINDPQKKNAIHGFVCQRPWKVTARSEPPKTTWRDRWWPSSQLKPDDWLEASFDSRDHSDVADLWPGQYVCNARYSLTAYLFGLMLRFSVTNVGDTVLPFGLGFHPYFRIRVDTARIALQLVKGPVELEAWDLVDFLPTGEFRPLTPEESEIIGNWPNGPRSALGSNQLDGVYHIREPKNEPVYSMLGNEDDGLVITQTDEAFQTHVLFTPAHREAVCIEPYTCPTDGINLHQRGISCGLLLLNPGKTWATTIGWNYHPGNTNP